MAVVVVKILYFLNSLLQSLLSPLSSPRARQSDCRDVTGEKCAVATGGRWLMVATLGAEVEPVRQKESMYGDLARLSGTSPGSTTAAICGQQSQDPAQVREHKVTF